MTGGARFLTDLEVVLRDQRGVVIDERAQAREISASGFRVKSQQPLCAGMRLTFTMEIGPGEIVRGAAKLAWAEKDEWGWHTAQARIVKMSWADKRKLRVQTHRPGYDFPGLARKALLALFWLVVVAGAQNVMFKQPAVRQAIFDSLPALGAGLVLAAGLWLLLG